MDADFCLPQADLFQAKGRPDLVSGGACRKCNTCTRFDMRQHWGCTFSSFAGIVMSLFPAMMQPGCVQTSAKSMPCLNPGLDHEGLAEEEKHHVKADAPRVVHVFFPGNSCLVLKL